MAKRQTFGDKVAKAQKGGPQFIHVKVVRAAKNRQNCGVRFVDEIVRVPIDENVEKFVTEHVTKAN